MPNSALQDRFWEMTNNEPSADRSLQLRLLYFMAGAQAYAVFLDDALETGDPARVGEAMDRLADELNEFRPLECLGFPGGRTQ